MKSFLGNYDTRRHDIWACNKIPRDREARMERNKGISIGDESVAKTTPSTGSMYIRMREKSMLAWGPFNGTLRFATGSHLSVTSFCSQSQSRSWRIEFIQPHSSWMITTCVAVKGVNNELKLRHQKHDTARPNNNVVEGARFLRKRTISLSSSFSASWIKFDEEKGAKDSSWFGAKFSFFASYLARDNLRVK